ncbi:uncharacterized protein LOC111692935 [Anoplophora glabripennis]|uniref:uncharacterized protein LOC108906802 n=1 Tax=Anoplophora glabripennis TaxID=217634 RepID=UPI000874697A|nr:uncharacterized protein LOC108906802 [Anoplophora glabripennis]XP_023312833.1 uncharacterized protein LOC111692935 [Anoplophora glabripennis]
MKLVRTLSLIKHPTLDTLKKSLRLTIDEAPQYLSKVREENKKLMYDKLNRLNKWYVKVIGLDEVKLYQDRVTSLQDQLLETQEKRREVGRQLADIRQKSLELQDQIHKVKRQEDLQKFLDLMREETEILKLENSVSRTFQDYDQTERELFTAFTNAIRDSHEKQRAQLEYTKYFGLILSMAGSFLAFVYTSVKKQDLKRFMEEKLSSLERAGGDPVVLNLIQANEHTVREVIKNRQALEEVVKVLERQGIREPYVVPLGYVDNETTVDIKKVAIGLCLLFLFVKMVSG